MKIFERSEKSGWGNRLNIIDENNVFVGYDYDQQCCEDFEYYLTDNIEKLFDKAEALDEQTFCHDGYVFDTAYIKEHEDEETCYGEYFVAFRLTKQGEKDIFLVLYNCHNGYYSHGFEMRSPVEGGKCIHEGAL
jgi:hypothetical protein